ncbi:hypothetical protein RRF57_000865 [Xylaria bambusicola]|uniref:Uncharacterized protein n=1 Tax=Xylaria bambusicola TaxID=326684 RepID=A0AAN7UAK2_9PEZI
MSSSRSTVIQELVHLLTSQLDHSAQPDPSSSGPMTTSYKAVLTGIQRVVSELIPGTPLSATFHDGKVHDPLGGGAYAFQQDYVTPILRALLNDENPNLLEIINARSLPTRPIVIHASLQPYFSPHIETLVGFSFTFAFAQALRDRMLAIAATGESTAPPPVTVLITLIDTTPVKSQSFKCNGTKYQKSYKDVPEAVSQYMADWEEVFRFLSVWSGISFHKALQADLFSDANMPDLVNYLISQRAILGPQLLPKYGSLAIRSACPKPGCSLIEVRGQLNEYQTGVNDDLGAITFSCPHHGDYTINLSRREEVARLEADSPVRTLLRTMAHLLDTSVHNICITSPSKAGIYQETLLYRPLAA